jgi:parallel beta-helix repeat protein
VVVCTLACAATAPARIPAGGVRCGQTIVSSTKLDRDLINCPNNGLIIGADNITLDLNGHVIDGDGVEVTDCPPDQPCDLGVLASGHNGIIIKGGSVRQFTFGVIYDTADGGRLSHLDLSSHLWSGLLVAGASETRIDMVTASKNGLTTDQAGVDVFDSHDLVIEGNHVAGNGDIGFFISGLADSRLAANTLERNPEAGFLLDAGTGNTFVGNQISAGGDAIVVSGDRNRVIANRLVGAACEPACNGYGVSVEGGTGNVVQGNLISRFPQGGVRVASFEAEGGPPTTGTTVAANVVRASAVDGVLVEATAADTLLRANIATGSGDDGLDVQSATTTLTRNLAVHNGDLGIEAVDGVIDGGGNKAFANGNSTQCTNVHC